MAAVFDHEKLAVYQRSIAFVGWAETIIEAQPKAFPREINSIALRHQFRSISPKEMESSPRLTVAVFLILHAAPRSNAPRVSMC